MKPVFALSLSIVFVLASCAPEKKPAIPLPTVPMEDFWETPDLPLPEWSQAFGPKKFTSTQELSPEVQKQIGIPPQGLSIIRGSIFYTQADESGFQHLYVYNGEKILSLLQEDHPLWKGSLGLVSRNEIQGKIYLYARLGHQMGTNFSSGWTLDLNSGLVHRDPDMYKVFAEQDFKTVSWEPGRLLGEEFFAWDQGQLVGLFRENGQRFVYSYDGQKIQKKFPIPATPYPLTGQKNSMGHWVFSGVENFDDFNGFQYWSLMEFSPQGDTVKKSTGIPQTEVLRLLPQFGLETLRQFSPEGLPGTANPSQGIPLTLGPTKLYQEPKVESPVVTTLPESTSLEILKLGDKAQEFQGIPGIWYRVKTLKGQEGWVFGAFIEEKQVFSASDPLAWNDFQLTDSLTGARLVLGGSWRDLVKGYEALGKKPKLTQGQDGIQKDLGPLIMARLFLPPDGVLGDFGGFQALGSQDRIILLKLKTPAVFHRRNIQVGQSLTAALSQIGRGPGITTETWEWPGVGRIYGLKLEQTGLRGYLLLELGDQDQVKGMYLTTGELQD